MALRRILMAALVCILMLPCAAARASADGVVDVFSLPGATAAIDPSGSATIDDAVAGRLPFVSAGSLSFPHTAALLRPLTVWLRIPTEPAWRSGTYALVGSVDVSEATLYAPDGSKGWTATQFGMGVPYAERSTARLIPAAQIPGTSGPFYVRLRYVDESAGVTVAGPAAVEAQRQREDAQEPFLLVFIGIFVALALGNLILYGFALQRTYPIYSLAMVFAALSAGVLGQPFAWKWFWPHASPPYYLTLAIVAAGFENAIVLFSAQLLDLRSFAPRLYRGVLGVTIGGTLLGISMVLWFASAQIGALSWRSIVETIAVVPYILMIAAAVAAWRRGDGTAPFVLLGYVCHAAGLGVFLATLVELRTGIFPSLGTAIDGMLLYGALAARLRRLQREALENAVAAAQQRRLAYTDGLTGVANRRAYDEALEREWERSSRDGTTLSMVLIDVDYFKRYNDTYGHAEGDACLQQVARTVEACVRRPSDLFARYGGEEFVALLPGTSEAAALEIARQMCDAVRKSRIVHAASSLGVVSISAGVASSIAPPLHEPTLAREADEALYLAKRGGRNRVASRSYSDSGSRALD